MLESDFCSCSHRRSDHKRRAEHGGEAVHCSKCMCDGFIRDPNRGWLVFIRAAELAARSGAFVQVARIASSHVIGNPIEWEAGWQLTIRTRDDLDIDAPSDAEEASQLADLTAMRWLERHASAARLDPERAGPDSGLQCPTCLVIPGVACRPMHAGERDAGAWSHPMRGRVLFDSEVVAWAMRVKAGDQREVWPGLKATANMTGSSQWQATRRAVDAVVDEILALKYIRDTCIATHVPKPTMDKVAAYEHGGPFSILACGQDAARNPIYLFRGRGLIGIGDDVCVVADEEVERARHKPFGRVVALGAGDGTVWVRPVTR